MKNNLLAIVGPTAVGKTEVSIEIAKKFNGEIISGDSMQVYKGMDIGTAKIKTKEMQGIKHHLIDCFYPDDEFSVAKFQKIVKKEIIEINKRGNLPILVGGTGLYVKSVTHNYEFSTVVKDEEYRKELEEYVKINGKEKLYNKLIMVAPNNAEKLHPNDVKRIIRALEIYHINGELTNNSNCDKKNITPYNLRLIGLTMEREKLYSRINMRVDNMLEQGLIEEVKELLKQGYSENLNSMKGIGYKEIVNYLQGEISLEEAIEDIKKNSRRYAKRQLTWFRHMSKIDWFDITDCSRIDKEKKLYNIFEIVAGML